MKSQIREIEIIISMIYHSYYTTLQNAGLWDAYHCNEMQKVEELVSGCKDTKYAIVSFVFDIVIHFFK